MKVKLLHFSEMSPLQQVLYELLAVGEQEEKNTQRQDLVDALKRNDPNTRHLVKSLLPFAPVVASRGYYIATTPEEVDAYITKLESKIAGLQRNIAYLKKHRKNMVNRDEF